uniref:Uncharacterized protein n=1 Tax=Esox lucius TaxID=8010 RepID=A0AAY5KTL3_ESOLU
MSFGWFSKAEVKSPDVDVSLPKEDISLPEGKVEVKKPDVEMTAPEMTAEVKHDIELQGQGSKFKLPKFGISMPKVTGPQIDLGVSKKEIDVTLPGAKVEVQPPNVELQQPSGEVNVPEGAATDVDVKMKKPHMSFGWFSKAEVKSPEVDVSLPKVDISLPEGKVEVKKPDVEITAPEMTAELKHDIEVDAQGSKFKLPKFGISMPKVKGPQIDLGVSKKEIDVTLPGAKVEVQPPNVELQQPSGEVNVPEGAATDVDVKMKKPHMSFGWFSKAEVKSPEVDVSLPKVDISLPEGKVEVKKPDVEITAPEMTAELKHDIEVDAQGSKFKLPKFGISMPKVKGPQIDLGVSKKEIDVTLPGAKVEVQPPNVELQQPSGEVNVPEGAATDVDVKMKKPHMSFGWFSKAEVKSPEVDVSLPKVDISLPEAKVEVKKPDVEKTAPEMTAELKHDVEVEGPGSKFKLPKFGISMPKVKGPQIDLGVSKKEIDVTLPGAKVDCQPPNVEAKLPSGEVNIPEGAATDVDVKMKKPQMSFGWFSKAEVKSPEVDVSLPKVDISLPEAKVEVKKPDVEMTAPEMTAEVKHDIELQGQGSKFKLPKFGISMPKVTGPQIDLGVSKKEIDVTLPGAKVEVQPPNVELQQPSGEVNLPEGAATDVDVKMKKPQMSFGWFSKAEVKSPEVDVSLPKVDISLPEGKVEVKKPDVEMTAPEMTAELKHDVEVEGPGSKFKLPKFGISMPKVKGPQIDLGVSKKEIDVTLPGAKVDCQPPNVELQQPSGEVNIPERAATDVDLKMKKPQMSFGWFSKAEVKSPEVDVSLPKVDISLPEGKVEVKKPEMERTAPEMTAELKHEIELDGQGSKFKLPKFGISMPKVKGPQIDLGVSKKEIDVTLPGAKVEVQPPIVEPKLPSDVEITVDGQGSKFKLPKFGISMPKVKGPQIDLGVSKKEIDVIVPGAKVEVQPPNVELQQPSGEVNIPEGAATDVDVKMKKPHMSFGWFSKAEVKSPEVDVSLPTVDISHPGGKFEVKKPDLETTAPEIQVDVQVNIPEGATTEIDAKMKKPRMSFGWFSKPELKPTEVDVSHSQVDISLPERKVDVNVPEIEMSDPGIQLEMKQERSSVKIESSEVDTKDVVGSPSRFKMPNIKFPKFGATSKVLIDDSDKDKDMHAEVVAASFQRDFPESSDKVEGSSEINLHDAGLERPSVEGRMARAEVDDISKPSIDDNVHGSPNKGQASPSKGQGSPSKFKLPTFKMPKLRISKSKTENEQKDITPNVILENNENPEEPHGQEKSTKFTLTTFGEPPPVWRCMNVGDVVVFLLSGTWQCCSGCTWVSGH